MKHGTLEPLSNDDNCYARVVQPHRPKTALTQLLTQLRKDLSADHVVISRINGALAETLAFVSRQGVRENLYFSADNNAWSSTLKQGSLYLSRNLKAIYPSDDWLHDLGIQGFYGTQLLSLHDDDNQYIAAALFESPVKQTHLLRHAFQRQAELLEAELQKQHLQTALKLSKHIVHHTQSAISITDRHKTVVYVNKAFTQLTGWLPNDVIGQHDPLMSSEVRAPSDRQHFWPKLYRDNYWMGDIIVHQKNGQRLPASQTVSIVRDSSGKVLNYVSMMIQQPQSKYHATPRSFSEERDNITGHFSRDAFIRSMEQCIDQCSREQKGFHLFVLDVDYFKEINSLHGYDMADELLVAIGERLHGLLDQQVNLARLGSDQFGFVLLDLSPSKAAAAADAVRQHLAQPYRMQGHRIDITVSVGVSRFPQHTCFATNLLNNATLALDTAKSSGRNTVVFFEEAMQHNAVDHIVLRRALARAIDQCSLQVHYQPVIDSKTGQLVKLEALARWRYKGQWISPEQFVPIAEQYGMVYDLGLSILEQACATLKGLKQLGHSRLTLNVNRSIKELDQPDCSERWLDIISQHGLQPKDITFELTESVLTESDEHLAHLKRLRTAGCKISLDDFGTGYSSIHYLRRLTVDELKIDRCFIEDIDTESDTQILVKTILFMTQSLGIPVVAEGVETRSQQRLLQELDCQMMQGFLTGRPMDQASLLQQLSINEPDSD